MGGIQCHGMGDVVVQPGFFAGVEAPGFVWQCHGPGWRRCPGGAPGTCAERRDNTSIACGQCEAFTRMTNAGPCEVCGGPDIGLLFGAAIAILVLLWCVYWVLAHENKAKRKEVCTLA